jgi:hypothetical protein
VNDVGPYCRAIERHLTKVNAGHLVRIVGPGFALVRQWHQQGIPLSVVLRGIEAKADRHRDGRSTRPLRIEFCEADVRHEFATWRRAVGVPAGDGGPPEPATVEATEGRRPSLGKHLERALDRLTRAAGRLDLPDGLRDELGRQIEAVTELRRQAAGARGAAREAAIARLTELDAALLAAVRASAPPELRQRTHTDAERELRSFKSRLAPDQWQRAVDASSDRGLRDAFGLPTLEL